MSDQRLKYRRRRGAPGSEPDGRRSPGFGNLGSDMAEANDLASRLFGSVVSGALLGWLLDWWLGSFPWLAMLGTVIGSVLGFWRMVVYAKGADERRSKDRS